MTIAEYHIEPLTIKASTEHLQSVRAYVQAHIESLDFSEFEENNIVVAVDEAVSNLIRHAYHNDASQSISICISVDDTEVSVHITDTADAFDPATAELPDMRRYFLDHRRGGLGILLMVRVMDKVTYEPAKGARGANMLTLTKHRSNRSLR